MIDVSIVIVCMNNWDNISRCLDSIRKYTSVSYEVLLVAYLFSDSNLERLRKEYPWITIIVNNEIKGFSENNNLALRQASGRYCFVLNDDTELTMPAIDRLVSDMDSQPDDVAIISPVLLNPDGSVQVCGRPPMAWKQFVFRKLHLWNETGKSDYVNGHGLFTSYNIVGAAFLIRTGLFKKIGWFDETYFFTPEDIALSTTLNKMGYRCLVDTAATIVHFGGMSGLSPSMTQAATLPAAAKGEVLFFSCGNKFGYIGLATFTIAISLLTIPFNIFRQLVHPGSKVYKPMIYGYWNVAKSLLSHRSPKQLFIKYYYDVLGLK